MTDSDGTTYIDAIGGLFLVNVGHGRTEIAEAVADQLGALHYANTFAYPAVPTIKLSKKLAELAPGDLDRVFLASGGSEAVDTASEDHPAVPREQRPAPHGPSSSPAGALTTGSAWAP